MSLLMCLIKTADQPALVFSGFRNHRQCLALDSFFELINKSTVISAILLNLHIVIIHDLLHVIQGQLPLADTLIDMSCIVKF